MSVQVKICGITNIEDAVVAAEAGADYLGFIFYPPSPRAVGVEVAREIVVELRAREDCPQLVGVFVNESAEKMAEILDVCGLDWAQLSGEEPPACLFEPTSPLYGRGYKALRPSSAEEAEAEAEWFKPPQRQRPALLLDAYHPTLRGGTGETADWEVAARLARMVRGLMLAGGLTAENVAEAVARVRPWGVDVASGVEASKGRKDHEKVRAFVAAAKGG
ncbi:MAG TPA: phosphoribosylanthranilate isomerase [Anaerolineae bacterium]|nr:phosphoribosylanthranilate isomerase [Anaerolineae bacterium]